MTLSLRHHHDSIRQGLVEMRRHCAASLPDLPALSATRLRQSKNFSANSRYIYDVLIPQARAGMDAGALRAFNADIRLLNDKRFAISAHIAKWGSREIGQDWEAYRTIALEICDLVDAQLQIEQRCLAQFADI